MSLSRSVVIVGYGPGLGAALAEKFAAEGYEPALIARNPESLTLAADGLSTRGVMVRLYPTDIAQAGGLAATLNKVRQEAGNPEVVIYNAAAWRPGPVLALPRKAWTPIFAFASWAR